MVSLQDCIERIPSNLENILINRKAVFHQFLVAVKKKRIDEIILIGSGTSNTAAVTARPFMEKVGGIRTTVVTSNEFLYDRYVRNKSAIYVFISQTGTSNFVRKAQAQLRAQGFLTAAISESEDTLLAKETAVFIDMGCGQEEYPTRTIGYSTSVFTLMLMGLEIGLLYGTITDEQYQEYLSQAGKVPESNRTVIRSTLQLGTSARNHMLMSQLIVFTGAGSLYGLALEAAMKVWEIPRIASVGYELEEGLHGPNYGYNPKHCVIVLNDGREEGKALSLARYMKEIKKTGFVFGCSVIDQEDLQIELQTKEFTCLELAPAVQILAYLLAIDTGRDLFAPHDNSKMEEYFKTHA